MLRPVALLFLIFISSECFSQEKLDKLTVEKIMRDPKWMGTSPSQPQWSHSGNELLFLWNPANETNDSSYFITKDNKTPVKASVSQKQNFLAASTIVYNLPRTAYTFAKDGDIFYTDLHTNTTAACHSNNRYRE